MSGSIYPAARRAEFAVIAAVLLAVVAPVAIWLDERLLRLALLGQGVLLDPYTPLAALLRGTGMVVALLPSACLAWGLFGLIPALRHVGRGDLVPRVGTALRRLGLSVLLVGLYEPLGRAVLLGVLTAAPGRLTIEFGVSANAILLVMLGATLMALGPVLRSAAAALEENRGFV